MQQPEIAIQLTACGCPVFPCWDNKQPAVKGGFKAASTQPGNYWPSDLIGIPVPDAVIVIDIDAHKGMTTDLIEQALGCQLDWAGALLQFTPSGGAHYAFQVAGPMRQGSDLFEDQIGKGFDTRVTGRGYICAGGAYHSGGDPIGVLKLAAPAALPLLPAAAVAALAAVTETQHTPAPLPHGDRNSAEVETMLRCLDANCPRSEWLNVALALKHHYHDDDGTGWAIFDNWSMTGGDAYDPVEARKLWATVKPTADDGRASVTLATIAHKAIQNGYVPSSVAADVFGTGAKEESADLQTVETLIARINAEGGKPEQLDALTSAIRELACNSIQRAALTATLQRTLKDHGIKITEAELRKATAPQQATPLVIPQPVAQVTPFRELKVSPVQALGNVHIQNAGMLRQAVFGDRLARFGSEVYWWTGIQWESVSKSDLNAAVAHSFIGSEFGKTSNIDGTDKQLRNMVPSHRELNPASRSIYFVNGVLDLMRPDLGVQAHDATNFNASTLTVEYTPGQPHPHWDAFLSDIFAEELDRITLLQEIMGWMLISDNLGHQKAIALDGVPRSGKGTILEVIGAILGQGLADISLAQLIDNKSLSGLRTVNLAVDRDAKRPAVKDISSVHSQFNKITANEPVSIPLLFIQDPWVGRLNCKLAIACNGIPVMADDSGAAPNRWVVLKFTKSFLGKEDLGLSARLRSETGAIAAWAVEGLRRLMQNGQFSLPESSLEESHALIDVSSPLKQFAEDRLIVGGDRKVHGDTLWESYRQWCKHNNISLGSKPQFIRALERALQGEGVHYKRSVKINNIVRTGLIGVGLADCADGVDHPKVTPIAQALKEAPTS